METQIVERQSEQSLFQITFFQVAESFLFSCVGHTSRNTIRAYKHELDWFTSWLQRSGITLLMQVTADVIRRYLVFLAESRNSGGVHIAYRVIKTCQYWWEKENDGDYYAPIHKVKSPKLVINPIEGTTLDQVHRMIDGNHSTHQVRDKAMLLFLFDTGIRASEFTALNVGDLDKYTGKVSILHGKGDKYRLVYIGQETRKAVRAYLKTRMVRPLDPLFLSGLGDRFTYAGLRQVIERRCLDTGVPIQSPHDFRRGFALSCLRNGMDVYTLQRLMGHADLKTLLRYLHFLEMDVSAAYMRSSPVDMG